MGQRAVLRRKLKVLNEVLHKLHADRQLGESRIVAFGGRREESILDIECEGAQ